MSTDAQQFKIVSDAHRLMVEELSSVHPKKKTNQGVMIRCPFHDDSSPSLSINLVHKSDKPVGLWFCFGCNERGLWNKLAAKLGKRKVDSRFAHQITEFHGRKLQNQALDADDMKAQCVEHWKLDYLEPWPAARKWRGFPGAFISAFGAELAVDTERKCEVLLFPVMVGDEPVGYVKALLAKSEKRMSYLNSEGPWSSKTGLFGYEWARRLLDRANERDERAVLFVVEGPRDALRLLYYGIPAVAILGANIWSPAKRNLMLALNAQRVVLFLDSDGAGVKATKRLKSELMGHTEVRTVATQRALREANEKGHKLKKIDAANMPLWQFQALMDKHRLSYSAGGWKAVA